MSANQSSLRSDIEAEIGFDPSVDAKDIGVSEDRGVCTLTGHVGSFCEKHAAGEAASRVRGVRAVAQRIEVRLPSCVKHGPDEIAKRAANVICWNVMLPDDVIKVEVENGWITLTGNVDWQYQKRAAEAGIRVLSGVVGITNMITISHHAAVSDRRRPDHEGSFNPRPCQSDAHGHRRKQRPDRSGMRNGRRPVGVETPNGQERDDPQLLL